MMKLLPALLLVVPLFADDVPPPLVVHDVKATVGDWIVLRAVTEGRIVRWKSVTKGIKIAPPELQMRDGKTSLATASKKGVYIIHAVTAKGDVPSEIVAFRVTVEDDDPGPPDPPVPPDPPGPGPVDPLTKKIQDALASDAGVPADKKKWAATLSGFYAAMAVHVKTNQVATIGDLLNDYQKAGDSLLPKDAIANTRKVAGLAVFTLSGEDGEKVIDPALAAKFVELFDKLAKALGG